VKLLPGFVFDTIAGSSASTTQKENDPSDHSTIESGWADFLASQVGCASVQLSALPAEVHGHNVLPSSPKHGLSLSIQQSLPNHAYVISLDWDKERTKVRDIVVETTVGGLWQGEDAVCPGGQRRILTALPSEIEDGQPLVVGTLQIRKDFEDTTVTLHALFAVADDDEKKDVLYMPAPLKITVDPQKQMERRRRKDTSDIREQLQVYHAKEDGRADLEDTAQYAQPFRHQRQPSSERTEDNNRLLVKKQAEISDSQEDDHPGLLEKKKKRGDEERRKDRRRYRTDRTHHEAVPPNAHRHKPKETYHHAFIEPDSPVESSKRFLSSHRNDEYVPYVSFDSTYFSALVFFIGSMMATIQTCRFASVRVSKGRRDL
jgi:hypothetical protein